MFWLCIKQTGEPDDPLSVSKVWLNSKLLISIIFPDDICLSFLNDSELGYPAKKKFSFK